MVRTWKDVRLEANVRGELNAREDEGGHLQLVLRWEKGAAPRVRGLLCGEPEVRLEGGELRIRTAPVQTWEVLTVEA